MDVNSSQKAASPLIYLLGAAVISSVGTPVVKWLIIHGGPFGISAPGAVSYCNLLFIGNICASILMLFFYSPKKIFKELKKLNRKGLILILAVSLISAISAMLFFIALETLTVVNVVLIQRLDGVFFAIIAISVYHERINKMNVLSYAFIIIGLGVEIYFVNQGHISKAIILMILSTILYASKPVFSKFVLQQISPQAMLFLNKILIAIIFFVLALYYYGPHHFYQLTEGKLWLGTSVYALIVVLLGSFLWYSGVKTASTKLITNLKLFTPLLSIVIAIFLLSEQPSIAEWIAVGIVVIGALLGQIKIQKPEAHEPIGSPLRGESIDRSIAGGG